MAKDELLSNHAGSAEGGGAAAVRREVLQSLGVCFFYISMSSAMVFTNKALSYNYGFTMTNALLLMQMVFTIALLHFLRDICGLLSFNRFERDTALRIAPISVFYCLNGAFALVAVRELSVPSYTLVKRLAPMFSITLEFALLGKRSKPRVLVALAVMLSGTLLAARADTRGTILGWSSGLVSCFLQGLYLTLVKKTGAETGLNSFGVLYYHSLISLPILSVLVVLLGEMQPLLNYPQWTDMSFMIVLAWSLFMGVMLNYSLFLATELTSPTSTLVSGQVKAIGQTAIGMFTFGGAERNQAYIIGTLMNIGGGTGYGYSKYLDMKERADQQKLPK
ncbi:UDP-galactose/UDP-glucose transporter 7 [Porphyridium purpureum]|uniref:UDP-galactose/UDP-glucose transporter 7 n=1 Tax=Porphyridium purpureum TaxID=35688 RepID=A0A5J4YQR3_PORPP|nr:UDP-galactose/UDP-glucose transporter 7 [Porphyridium purpureum]|eukprot:POR5458..scf222_8